MEGKHTFNWFGEESAAEVPEKNASKDDDTWHQGSALPTSPGVMPASKLY